tara:strand:- start:78 stop:494 length:417 start_codon:yes stop_codon:yes gene_type:complete
VDDIKLTKKQDAFIKAYLLNGGNATRAAIEAGYSEDSARFVGAENLTKPNIKKALAQHQSRKESDFIWSKEKKLEILQKIIKKASLDDDEKGMINMPSAIAAIKEHNLMQGDNAPIETNNNIKVSSTLAARLTGGSKR